MEPQQLQTIPKHTNNAEKNSLFRKLPKKFRVQNRRKYFILPCASRLENLSSKYCNPNCLLNPTLCGLIYVRFFSSTACIVALFGWRRSVTCCKLKALLTVQSCDKGYCLWLGGEFIYLEGRKWLVSCIQEGGDVHEWSDKNAVGWPPSTSIASNPAKTKFCNKKSLNL